MNVVCPRVVHDLGLSASVVVRSGRVGSKNRQNVIVTEVRGSQAASVTKDVPGVNPRPLGYGPGV